MNGVWTRVRVVTGTQELASHQVTACQRLLKQAPQRRGHVQVSWLTGTGFTYTFTGAVLETPGAGATDWVTRATPVKVAAYSVTDLVLRMRHQVWEQRVRSCHARV